VIRSRSCECTCRARRAHAVLTRACRAVHSAVEVELAITNPLDEGISLAAQYGHASLTGPQTFSLKGKQSGTFAFYFAPLTPGKGESSLKLVHPDVGEFWYQVHHNATPAKPKQAKLTMGAVGLATTAKVPFANPLDRKLRFSVTSSDTQRFTVAPHSLVLEGLKVQDVTVTYTPRSVGREEYANLVLENEARINAHAESWLLQCSAWDAHRVASVRVVVNATIMCR
jgi:hypothetical protein